MRGKAIASHCLARWAVENLKILLNDRPYNDSMIEASLRKRKIGDIPSNNYLYHSHRAHYGPIPELINFTVNIMIFRLKDSSRMRVFETTIHIYVVSLTHDYDVPCSCGDLT
jgi:hypothetical protein